MLNYICYVSCCSVNLLMGLMSVMAPHMHTPHQQGIWEANRGRESLDVGLWLAPLHLPILRVGLGETQTSFSSLVTAL